jgi:hypothetical protein
MSPFRHITAGEEFVDEWKAASRPARQRGGRSMETHFRPLEKQCTSRNLSRSVYFALIVILLIVIVGTQSVQGQGRMSVSQKTTLITKQTLGDELLRAAEAKDWAKARLSLQQGADPNVTAFHSARPVMDWRRRYALERLSPLSQAAAQGNTDAVTMLLRYGADPNIRTQRDPGPLTSAVEALQTECARLLIKAGADVSAHGNATFSPLQLAQLTGKHDLVRLLEDEAGVPTYKRSVPQEPSATDTSPQQTQRAVPYLVPGTEGAVATHHMLWASLDEVVVLFAEPRRFALVNIQTGVQSPLPELSKRWLNQEQFNPEMLAISPDGKWLVGYGGTAAHPTWLATKVNGTASQEWPRTPLENNEVRSSFAWIDAKRWVELAWKGGPHACIRIRGELDAQNIPILNPYRAVCQCDTVFRFSSPAEGRVDGSVGFSGSPAGTGSTIAWRTRFTPQPSGWRAETQEVEWKQTDHAGFFSRAILSPGADQMAWLAYYQGSSETAILLSKPDGTDPHVIYEGLPTVKSGVAQSWDDTVADLPGSGFLEWTPRGDSLVFWRGVKGLAILPLTATARPKTLASGIGIGMLLGISWTICNFVIIGRRDSAKFNCGGQA